MLSSNIKYERQQASVDCCSFFPSSQNQISLEALSDKSKFSKDQNRISLKKSINRDNSNHFHSQANQNNHESNSNLLRVPQANLASNSNIFQNRSSGNFENQASSYRLSIQNTPVSSSLISVNRNSTPKSIPVSDSRIFSRVVIGSYQTKNNGMPMKIERFEKSDRIIQGPTIKLMKTTIEGKNEKCLRNTKQTSIMSSKQEQGAQHFPSLLNFKQSVYSIQSEVDNKIERLQQSQVLVDYFNPSQNKIKEIQNYLVVQHQQSYSK